LRFKALFGVIIFLGMPRFLAEKSRAGVSLPWHLLDRSNGARARAAFAFATFSGVEGEPAAFAFAAFAALAPGECS
jgi:hypothetical protein